MRRDSSKESLVQTGCKVINPNHNAWGASAHSATGGSSTLSQMTASVAAQDNIYAQKPSTQKSTQRSYRPPSGKSRAQMAGIKSRAHQQQQIMVVAQPVEMQQPNSASKYDNSAKKSSRPPSSGLMKGLPSKM